jgi:hypothetical protein
MHARLDELLNLREQLQALPPAPELANDGWPDVQARLAAAHARRRRMALAAPLAAAASVAALAVFATLRWADAPVPEPTRPGPLLVLETGALDDLRARSQALEQLLAALPERPAVERAGTSLPIETLEAQVQWLDHQLSSADGGAADSSAEQLWRDRVEVMDSLVRLRYVEAQRVAL